MKLSGNKHLKNALGFTLIEIVVTVAIFAIMMSISVLNYPRFSQILAFNTASENVLDVLKSSQITGSSRGGDYRGDGVYFDISNPFYFSDFLDATTTQDAITGNTKSDKAYSNNLSPAPAKLDLLSSSTKIQNKVKINSLCVKNTTDLAPVCGKSKLSIVFARPNLTANISDLTESSTGLFNFFEKGYIELFMNASAGQDKKCLIVYKYGQMELKQGSCISQI